MQLLGGTEVYQVQASVGIDHEVIGLDVEMPYLLPIIPKKSRPAKQNGYFYL